MICTPFCYEILVKYADDTNVLVPENTDVPLAHEYAQIEDWAVKNCVKINPENPKNWCFNVIIQRSGICLLSRVLTRYRLLGVIFQCNFNLTSHVDAVLNLCSQRLFLLKQLPDQGTSRGHLHRPTIFQAIVLTR